MAYFFYAPIPPPPLISLVLFFAHHLSEVPIAAGHSVADSEFLPPFGNFVCVCAELDYMGGAT